MIYIKIRAGQTSQLLHKITFNLVGSMWIHSQTGWWPDGPCQYMSVCPDKATDMSQTERCFPSLDSRFIYLSVKLILSYGITVFKTIKLQISL